MYLVQTSIYNRLKDQRVFWLIYLAQCHVKKRATRCQNMVYMYNIEADKERSGGPEIGIAQPQFPDH